MTRRSPLLNDALAGFLLVGLPFLVFLPSHRGEFVSDDHRFIVQNEENLERLGEPWVFFSDPASNSDLGDADIYRPLRTLSFAVDYRLFGLRPLGYHLHAVLLHSLVALLAYFVFRGTLGGRRGAALFGALFFALHPVTTEAVCWISSRADLQAALLMLAALLVARRAEDRPGSLTRLALLSLLALAGGFCKETAVMLPPLYVLEHRLRTGRWWQGAAGPLVAICLGCLAYLLVYLAIRDRGISGQVDFYAGSFASHLPYGLVGLAKAFRLALLPVGLNFFWETNLFLPLATLDLALASAGLGLTAVAAALAWRRVPAVTVGIVWFFVAILPAANIFLPLRTVLAERFAYVPLVGVALAAAALAAPLLRRRSVAALLPVAVLGLLAVGTGSRAADWSTQENLYLATLEQHPRSYAASYGLGSLLLRRAELAGGAERAADSATRSAAAFEQAAAVAGDRPRQLDALTHYARALCFVGRTEEAIETLGRIDVALTQDPSLRERARFAASARYSLAVLLRETHQLSQAQQVFERLLAEHGETARRLDGLAETLRARHDGRALATYTRALALDPDYHPARLHLAEMYLQLNLEGEARRQIMEVLARDPANQQARSQLDRLGG